MKHDIPLMDGMNAKDGRKFIITLLVGSVLYTLRRRYSEEWSLVVGLTAWLPALGPLPATVFTFSTEGEAHAMARLVGLIQYTVREAQ